MDGWRWEHCTYMINGWMDKFTDTCTCTCSCVHMSAYLYMYM